MITEGEFLSVFTILFNSTDTFGADFTTKLECYYLQFSHLELSQFKNAVTKYIRQSAKFPAVKELMDVVDGLSTAIQHADTAEMIAFDICRNGVYGNCNQMLLDIVAKNDGLLTAKNADLIAVTVKCLGGWRVLANAKDGDPFIRKRFREIYNGLKYQDEKHIGMLNPAPQSSYKRIQSTGLSRVSDVMPELWEKTEKTYESKAFQNDQIDDDDNENKVIKFTETIH